MEHDYFRPPSPPSSPSPFSLNSTDPPLSLMSPPSTSFVFEPSPARAPPSTGATAPSTGATAPSTGATVTPSAVTAPPSSATTPPTAPGGPASTDQELNLAMAMLAATGKFSDCLIICQDGRVKLPRAIVAFTFPHLYSALRSLQDLDLITVLAHEDRVAEMGHMVEEFLTRGLEPHHISQIKDSPEEEKEKGGEEEEEGKEDYEEEEEDDDDDMDLYEEDYWTPGFDPRADSDSEASSDTEILGEKEELEEELANLGCTCCDLCERKRKLAARKPRATVPYSQSSRSGKMAKKAARVAGIEGLEEARDVVDRVYRDFPELRVISTNPCSNLRLMTLIRDLRLSYNQVIDFLLFLFFGLDLCIFLIVLCLVFFLLTSLLISLIFLIPGCQVEVVAAQRADDPRDRPGQLPPRPRDLPAGRGRDAAHRRQGGEGDQLRLHAPPRAPEAHGEEVSFLKSPISLLIP